MSAALPEWLEPLLGPEEMRATDAWAIADGGVPGEELMARAGAAVAEAVAERAPGGRVVILCGKGNNGGDGLVAARLLREEGRDVAVLAVGELAESTGDARAALRRLPGAPPVPFTPEALAGAALAVDAVLGTGSSGEPREPARACLAALLAAGVPVLAVDVPSGVDTETGETADIAVRADATVTFHAAKPGLWISPGKEHAGEVSVVDIGIPAGAPVTPTVGLIGAGALAGLPRRAPGWSKFDSGAVLVCGGSAGLTGAPTLACEAAARAGAGYVTAAVPASVQILFELRLLEVMTVGLADADGALVPAAGDRVVERAERADAVVLGPGLGRAPRTLELARTLASRLDRPLVVDADGLNAHAGALERFADRLAPTALTPHVGELARLLGRESADVAAHRLAAVREAAAAAGAVVVLKGDDTLMAEPGGRVAVSRGGAPALATAGTGDVLSGVLGAFLARGLDPFHAACAAVWIHLEAGRIATQTVGSADGVIASDVIAALPRALASS
jgi:hydroxyethylthiazole kinase-like uncharacterized protein yjeF